MIKIINIKNCEYFNKHGYHFSQKLAEWAVSMMPGSHYTNQDLIRLGLEINGDNFYLANMVKSDFLNSSIPDEQHLILYIKDILNDEDGYEGLPLARFCKDCKMKEINIPWNKMI